MLMFGGIDYNRKRVVCVSGTRASEDGESVTQGGGAEQLGGSVGGNSTTVLSDEQGTLPQVEL